LFKISKRGQKSPI